MKKTQFARLAFEQTTNYVLQEASLWSGRCFCKPTSINIDITSRCNCRCMQCDIWKKDVDSELTTEQYKEIFSKLRKWMGKFNLTIGGGEPFMRKDLVELIAFASKNGILTNVLTNGILINEKIVSHLEQSGLNRIAISLDGFTPETNDLTRGIKGAFEKTLKAVDLLSGMKSGPLVTVSTIIMKTNLNDLVEMAKWADIKEINGILFQPLNANFAAEYKHDWYNTNELWIDNYNDVCRVLDELIEMKRRGTRIINSIKQLEDMKAYFKNPNAPTEKRKCKVGMQNFCITPNGDVQLCYQMNAIGNVVRDTPINVWNSEKAKQLRKIIKFCKRPCSILNCNYSGGFREKVAKFASYIVKLK